LYAVALVVLTLALRGNSQPQASYTITDLGTLGGSTSIGWAINNSGQVAGCSDFSTIAENKYFEHAFRYSGSTITDLRTLGSSLSEGFGINTSGQITGISSGKDGLITHAVRWTGSTIEDLDTLGGNDNGKIIINDGGSAINDNGQVVDSASTPDGSALHAVI